MDAPSSGIDLSRVVALLAAGVVAVPLFKRIGLGSVIGYLAAGILIGPFGLGLFTHPETILHIAELGVVMFLFVIGLEMEPTRLWSLRRDIFGLGLLQVLVCGALLTSTCNRAGSASSRSCCWRTSPSCRCWRWWPSWRRRRRLRACRAA
jgi:glutathione-regulated potassium-efflux system protein KefB